MATKKAMALYDNKLIQIKAGDAVDLGSGLYEYAGVAATLDAQHLATYPHGNEAFTVTLKGNYDGYATSKLDTSGASANATIISRVLTGFTSGAGVVSATDTLLSAIQKIDGNIAASGSGTVTSVSVVTANGVSGSVATESTTPAITLTLGNIVPTTCNGLTLASATTGFTVAGGTTSKTLTVNKTITLTSADDTSVVTLPSGSVTLLATNGSAASLTSFPTLNQNTTGSAATLTTSRNINGVPFNGSADISLNAAPVAITSGTTTITSAYNGKVITNYGATDIVTLQLDTHANLGATFEVTVINEIGIMSGANTITDDGNYKIHKFTANGTLVVPKTCVVEVLVVAGGGTGGVGSGVAIGGGGGGGGVVHKTAYSLVAGTYSVVVGAGGANSSIDSIVAVAGGAGGATNNNGVNGGCGGGAGDNNKTGGSATQGNSNGGTGYGYNGGNSSTYRGGGGGGAGGAGADGVDGSNTAGGAGYSSDITGSTILYGGGGASIGTTAAGVAGGANTGNGGGAGATASPGAGGSGVVIIKQWSGPIKIVPASDALADKLPGTASLGSSILSIAADDAITIRTTTAGTKVTAVYPAVANWVDQLD